MNIRPILMAAIAGAPLLPGAASAQSYRDVRHDRQDIRQDRRELRHDVRHENHREAREDRRNLRRDRYDRHQDWRAYRKAHRDLYRRSAYIGPRGYRYRPVTVGYRFAPAYYAPAYRINWSTYRLPRPHGYQRWVRYGNDVALVDVRTGRVLAVNRGFFW